MMFFFNYISLSNLYKDYFENKLSKLYKKIRTFFNYIRMMFLFWVSILVLQGCKFP